MILALLVVAVLLVIGLNAWTKAIGGLTGGVDSLGVWVTRMNKRWAEHASTEQARKNAERQARKG